MSTPPLVDIAWCCLYMSIKYLNICLDDQYLIKVVHILCLYNLQHQYILKNFCSLPFFQYTGFKISNINICAHFLHWQTYSFPCHPSKDIQGGRGDKGVITPPPPQRIWGYRSHPQFFHLPPPPCIKFTPTLWLLYAPRTF